MRRAAARSAALAAAIAVVVTGTSGCGGTPPPEAPSLVAAGAREAIEIADALEALIAEGRDRPVDRERAFDAVRELAPTTAADTLARAIVTGRLVQTRGLAEAEKVKDVERWAMRSRELDPTFRDEAAARLLGTLWVLAPGALLRHGDAEDGLALLDELARRRPDVIQNHLRLGEAYVALGDPEPATPHLCRCVGEAGRLRRDERALLEQLLRDGEIRCPADAGPAPALPPAPVRPPAPAPMPAPAPSPAPVPAPAPSPPGGAPPPPL